MNPDDKICYCYDVSLRKLLNFARREQPQCPSRMSECLGAGTGCGWCIPFLIKIAEAPDEFEVEGMSADEYAAKRQDYIRSDKPKNEF
ncbi:MAG: (2Fe-2S)-binding protein [Planctomycetota bacterium]|jgi:NAD(P)H-nitrite reductase large subunit